METAFDDLREQVKRRLRKEQLLLKPNISPQALTAAVNDMLQALSADDVIAICN